MREEIFEGKSEEEALLKASEVLGVNISDMSYDVLENETGLFGLFKKSVKIRVRVSDEPTEFVYRETHRDENSHEKDIEKYGGKYDERDEPPPEKAPPRAPREPKEPKETPIKGPDAVAALEGVLQRMGVGAEVNMDEDNSAVSLDISTDEEDVVVGRDGEVLSALQFVVNKMVNRFPESRKRVVVDAVGFRTRRRDSLGRLAEEMGEKAVNTGKIVRLSPMNAQDRRLVHLALKPHTGLTTRSEGDGMFRCLLIVPNSLRDRRSGRGGRGGGSRGSRQRRDRDRGPNE
ncbi:MAG: Jag N-terminal domain-containing protein [Deltaproteobacteria bacterium]|nr:Jag N-terminal domain-containing protein [Deltaproteobacteria bacterium]